ncbi:hypothetical protein JZ751_001989 [Albula glossodonta]|uniref:Sushi domain-containing protein n=1 Tax=Albula glossodonta TaxID=121402 RepID=A0A8T2P6T2_9TELE|nr:hypothetical protein JZ751_001989 [Albula glossodonta]
MTTTLAATALLSTALLLLVSGTLSDGGIWNGYPIHLTVYNSLSAEANMTYQIEIAYRGILIGAMTTLREQDSSFKFTFTEDRNYGPYLVSVNGVAGNNEDHTYWELLAESADGTIIRPDVAWAIAVVTPTPVLAGGGAVFTPTPEREVKEEVVYTPTVLPEVEEEAVYTRTVLQGGKEEEASTGQVDVDAADYWSGTAPLCLGGCLRQHTELRRDRCGDSSCCWVGYKSLCRVTCGKPDADFNAVVSEGGWWVGSAVNHTCRPGFMLMGNPSSVCRPDGTWTPKPTCLRVCQQKRLEINEREIDGKCSSSCSMKRWRSVLQSSDIIGRLGDTLKIKTRS